MNVRFLAGAVFAAGAALLLVPNAANAQATRTWVSGTGDDANPCSRTAPCKTFAGAISKTTAAGEINCIDAGGYGALTITKSIAIKCDNTEAGVLVSGTSGIVVSAAATDIVWISGIDFEGLGAASQNTSLDGIKITSAAQVSVVNCTIRGFTTTNGVDGNGIFLNNTGTTKLNVYDTLIADNSNVGVEVDPQAGATAAVDIERSRSFDNAVGFRANGTSSQNIKISVSKSVAAQNGGSGVSIANGGASTSVLVDHSDISMNAGFGLNATTGALRVGYSTITGNGTATNGGSVQSYGNNEINGNGVDTVPTPVGLH
jgi:hypothetical protein